MEKEGYRRQNKVNKNRHVLAELENVVEKYGGVSLGMGITYFQPPEFLIENHIKVIKDGHNHYTHTFGHLEARTLIAEHYSPLFDRTIDPQTEVLITSGAIGAINVVLQALITDKNDEIIIIEPRYYEYPTLSQLSGGTIRNIPLVMGEDNTWKLDLDIFKDTINSNTRVVLFNNPHNPTGKVFTFVELTQLTEIISEYPN